MLEQKLVLTPNEVAKLLMVSPVTLRQWAQKNKIKSHTTLGGHRRFMYKDVLDFAKERKITLVYGNGTQALRIKKILIVEDDRAFAELFATVLAKHNGEWEISIAYDGFEAGVKTQQLLPDIIFVDMLLPGILGDELCRNIKSNPALSAIRVIGMSGNMEREAMESFLASGAEDVLEKPLDFDKLFSILD